MKIEIKLENFNEKIINLPFFVFRKKNINQKGKINKLLFLLSSYFLTLLFKFFNYSTFCFIMNIFYKADGKIKWDRNNGFYYKIFNQKKIYFPNKYRISGSMVNHKYELDNLIDSYCLNNFELNDNDVIVDCGANIGSLFLSLNRYFSNFSYVGFEPDPNAFKCLDLNLKYYENVKISKNALSVNNGQSKLYLDSDHGDSSLEKFHSPSSIEVDLISLDNEKFTKIRLFKIDAEGHELDVIKGAKNTLKCIDFIAVDMGSEKGYLNENTVSEVTNYLIENGFKLVKFNEARTTGLFKNILVN